MLKSRRRVLAAWIAACVLIPLLLVFVDYRFHTLIDLKVYHDGALLWSRNQDVYADVLPTAGRFVFTYPPIAAIAFSPLVLFGWAGQIVVMSVLSLFALTVAGSLAARSTAPRRGDHLLVGMQVAMTCVVLAPVRDTLGTGQINLLLMALVMADCLLPGTRWPRGMGIGIAAGIKLTPLVFVLFFVTGRQWRACAVAVTTFVAMGLAGAVAAPAASARYWFSELLDTSRIGRPHAAANQSVRGALARLGLSGAEQITIWAAVSLVVLAVAVFVAHRARRHGHDLAALLVIALAGLLISPVSWVHHWVWVVPAVMLLRRHHARWTWPAISVLSVFLVGPHLFAPWGNDRELHWAWWQHVVCNGYLVTGLAVLAFAAWKAVGVRVPEVDRVSLTFRRAVQPAEP